MDWFREHKTGTVETVSLALKINAATVYFNLRRLVDDGDLRQGPPQITHDRRGCEHKRHTWELVEKDSVPRYSGENIVQRALAARPPLQVAWGPRC